MSSWLHHYSSSRCLININNSKQNCYAMNSINFPLYISPINFSQMSHSLHTCQVLPLIMTRLMHSGIKLQMFTVITISQALWSISHQTGPLPFQPGLMSSWRNNGMDNISMLLALCVRNPLLTSVPFKTRRSENDDTPQPLDQWTNSPFMGQQVGNWSICHCIQLTSLSFQANWPSQF